MFNNPNFQPNTNGPQYNNLNNAFSVNQIPFIERTDQRNRHILLHNNISENLLLEQIIDFNINIDSSDRCLKTYPTPVKMTVSFGGSGQSIITTTQPRSNMKQYNKHNENLNETIQTVYKGTPSPVINRKFKNVKYLKLDYVILPKTNVLIPDSEGLGSFPSSTYSLSTTESDKLTYQYKYLLLRINEIQSDRILGSNINNSGNCFILYPDKIMGNTHVMWLPTYGIRTYANSKLENISRLTLEICSPDGIVLNFYDTTIGSGNIMSNSDLKNDISPDINCNFAFILGSVENEMNTNTKFEY